MLFDSFDWTVAEYFLCLHDARVGLHQGLRGSDHHQVKGMSFNRPTVLFGSDLHIRKLGLAHKEFRNNRAT